MKILPNRIVIILTAVFLPAISVFAAPGPPPPSTPPPPPGLPLDGGLVLLLLGSLVLGFYKIHQYNIKKASR
ncbi:MAG: hypothetical protein C0525_12440 [Flavobacterium sp.]|nr:hypothetical protein [Flavobacterium sp.]PJE39441.1 MAG: hypothetical protein CUR32_12180 [Flavobacterium sp.] [Flavobacterium sp. FEMGT703F]